MKAFEIVRKYSKEFPNVWTFLWSPNEANNIPYSDKKQIYFLNKKGSSIIRKYFDSINVLSDNDDNPFVKDSFELIDTFSIFEGCDSKITNWLKNKEIESNKFVFIDQDRSGSSVVLTWRMVIKYWEGIFFAEDLTIFDETYSWCIYYNHNDQIFFGKRKNK